MDSSDCYFFPSLPRGALKNHSTNSSVLKTTVQKTPPLVKEGLALEGCFFCSISN